MTHRIAMAAFCAGCGLVVQACAGADSRFVFNESKADKEVCTAEEWPVGDRCVAISEMCQGTFVGGVCYSPAEEERLLATLKLLSAKVTEDDVFTGEIWDNLPIDKEDEESLDWSQPDVYGRIHGNDGQQDVDVKTDIEGDSTEPDWLDGSFYDDSEMTFTFPLARIHDATHLSRVFLWDDDLGIGFGDMIGSCAINPTGVELGQGIITAKDCFSEGEDSEGNILRAEGDEGNILELQISIEVVAP